MHRSQVPTAAITIALLLGGCSAADPSAVDPTVEPVGEPTETEATESQALTEVRTEPLTAGDITALLSCAGHPTGERVVHTAASDPNELLGQDGGYVARSDMVDTRVADELDGVDSGVVVEEFNDEDEAQDRADYIRGIIDELGLPGFEEFHFVSDGFLLRVTGQLGVDDAQGYADVFEGRPDGGPIEACAPTPPGPATLADIPQARSELTVIGELTGLDVLNGEVGLVQTMVDGQSIVFIVHNGTDEPVSRVEVSGRVRDSSGATLGTGSSQGTQPNVIEPGGYAFGIVYVGDQLPDDAQLQDPAVDFTSGLGEFENITSLIVEQPERTASGDIIGDASNPYDVDVNGPISVDAVCLDSQGRLTARYGGFADRDDVPAGESTTFTLNAFDDSVECDTLLVGSSGFVS